MKMNIKIVDMFKFKFGFVWKNIKILKYIDKMIINFKIFINMFFLM